MSGVRHCHGYDGGSQATITMEGGRAIFRG